MTNPETTAWPVLTAAHRALREVVAAVPAEAWGLPTPCAQWTVTQVFQHAVGDQIGYFAALTGGPGPDEDPFAPSGKLEAAPLDLLEPALAAAADAWSAVPPQVQDAVVPVPPFKLPATVGVGACALDAAVHAWDIAVATAQPSPLTPELAGELLIVAKQIVEPLRQYGVYAPVVAAEPGDDGDDTVAELLRYLGRDPGWSA